MATNTYVDFVGLQYYDQKLKASLANKKHSYTTEANAAKNWYRIANAVKSQIDDKPLHLQFMIRAKSVSAGAVYYEEWFVDAEVYGNSSGIRILGAAVSPFSQCRILYENTTASITNTTYPAIDIYLNSVLADGTVIEVEELYNEGFAFVADGQLNVSTVPTGFENRSVAPYGSGIQNAQNADYANYSKIQYTNISANTTLAINDTYAKRILNCTGTITLTVPSPNANTAWFWIKNNGGGVVTLHPASTSVYFDNKSEDLVLRPTEFILLACQSNGHYSIVNDGRNKVALVGRNTEVGTSTKHWFLVAETIVTGMYSDPYIDMKVYVGSFGNLHGGILGAHARIGATKGKTDSLALFWEYKTEGLNLNDFAITALDTEGTSTKIQIWYRNPNSYANCKFIVLAEQLSSDTLGQPLWTLTRARKSGADGDIETLDTGFSKVAYSTLSTIVNSISGNAATATKATQDGSGNVITTTYATKAEMPSEYVKNVQIETADTSEMDINTATLELMMQPTSEVLQSISTYYSDSTHSGYNHKQFIYDGSQVLSKDTNLSSWNSRVSIEITKSGSSWYIKAEPTVKSITSSQFSTENTLMPTGQNTIDVGEENEIFTRITYNLVNNEITFTQYDVYAKIATVAKKSTKLLVTKNNNSTSYLDLSYVGASPSASGTPGLVPSAFPSERGKFMKADGTWDNEVLVLTADPTASNAKTFNVVVSNDSVTTSAVPVTTTGNQTVGGQKTFTAGIYGGSITLASNVSTFDVSQAVCFTKTITANTTLSFSNVPADCVCCVSVILINGGSYAVTWPAGVKWTDNTMPVLTKNGTDVLTFITCTGGNVWYGATACTGVTA